jgi:hypothetical protein
VEQQRALKALLERNPDISTAGETTLELPFILVQVGAACTRVMCSCRAAAARTLCAAAIVHACSCPVTWWVSRCILHARALLLGCRAAPGHLPRGCRHPAATWQLARTSVWMPCSQSHSQRELPAGVQLLCTFRAGIVRSPAHSLRTSIHAAVECLWRLLLRRTLAGVFSS